MAETGDESEAGRMAEGSTTRDDVPVPHDPAAVTAAWLQQALGRNVLSFQRSDEVSTWGAHVRIIAEVQGQPAPLKLRVKIGSASVFGRSEVDYYLRDFVGLKEAPLVRCHHAAADGTHYHLLLDDMTDTHRIQDDVPVTGEYGRALVESVAKLHAHRWTRSPADAETIRTSCARPCEGLPRMLAAMEEGFSDADRARVAEALDWLPEALVLRAANPSGFSWVHGDLNPGNILAPISGPGQVLLLDYQPFAGPPISDQLAMSDLAHAMVLWWPEAARRMWASQVLEHWHQQLCSLGAGYASSDQLREDWQLCVARTLLVPVSRCAEPGAVTTHRQLWEMHVRRALAALADARG
ncbi:MAG: phosphotransferase [Burkholderiales bacterium]|nr:phosphotransferase [Burkholderiales bacterium]MBW8893513.1 phosphotransferase [Burkholderiales bacterium]